MDCSNSTLERFVLCFFKDPNVTNRFFLVKKQLRAKTTTRKRKNNIQDDIVVEKTFVPDGSFLGLFSLRETKLTGN